MMLSWGRQLHRLCLAIRQAMCGLGCLTKTCFWWKKLTQPALQIFGGCFEGIQKDFWFWQFSGGAQVISVLAFLHCRFSLRPHFTRQNESWVKIYNVKKVKTEMNCAPPKTYPNQKSFWIPSKQSLNTCRAGWANFFHQKHVMWNTLVRTHNS